MLFIYLFLRQNLFFLFRFSRARLPMITQIFRGVSGARSRWRNQNKNKNKTTEKQKR